MAGLLRSGTYDAEGFRTCSVTGLRIHRSVERYVKLFALTAVVALLVGDISAIFVALTRWEVIGLADPPAFYKWLSIHAWNLLIFWMVFMEVAILYTWWTAGTRPAHPSSEASWNRLHGDVDSRFAD